MFPSAAGEKQSQDHSDPEPSALGSGPPPLCCGTGKGWFSEKLTYILTKQRAFYVKTKAKPWTTKAKPWTVYQLELFDLCSPSDF